jgi:hypothetical protein
LKLSLHGSWTISYKGLPKKIPHVPVPIIQSWISTPNTQYTFIICICLRVIITRYLFHQVSTFSLHSHQPLLTNQLRWKKGINDYEWNAILSWMKKFTCIEQNNENHISNHGWNPHFIEKNETKLEFIPCTKTQTSARWRRDA